ncbi:Gfo/Idh/MocA family oxidoreductase, partial [bacterium]|nr:Gfo/Idh/MocA family oxidoreductase [bacterium]
MLRIAVIGIGAWGRNLLRSFSDVCDVVAISSTGSTSNLKQAKVLVPKAETKPIEAILDSSDIDALVIAVPITRLDVVVNECIRSGKHLFIEKPAATSLSSLERIMQHQQAGQVCQIGYLFTYDPCFLALQEHLLVDENIRLIHWEWKKWGTFGSDILLNLACHGLSTIISLTEKCPAAVLEAVVDENTCDIRFQVNSIDISLKIDRMVRLQHRHFLEVTTAEGTYCWTPGLLTAPNGVNKMRKIDLIDRERDIFLD